MRTDPASAMPHADRMRRPTPLPNELPVPAFSTRDAQATGVTQARLRAPDLTRPFHGTRVMGPAGGLEIRARAYARKMTPEQHFSHLTSARLQGMRMPDGARDGPIHVTVAGEGRAPRGAGVIGHTAKTATTRMTRDGLRVSTPVETWLDLGASLSIRDLVVMGDGLVSKNSPVATLEQLHEAVAARSGRRGYRPLCAALTLVRARTDSARETMLRLIIIDAGLPEPDIDVTIVNRFGAEIAHTDLGYPRYRVLIEYDGAQHYTDVRQFSIDVERLDDLMEENWRVIRVDRMMMAKRATLIGKITTALLAGGWSRTLNA